MKPDVSLIYSQKPANITNTEPVESSQHPHILFIYDQF
jgi:hypothetical protein